jgi:uncharacterized protein (DUF1015 family)
MSIAAAAAEELVPTIKPFRALRYELDAVGDLGLVTSPPYDVILPEEYRALLARHPKNVVRLDLPADEIGDEPDDRYRRAARTFAAWRSDGTFHKDPKSAIYVCEQAFRLPGSDAERTQRGFLARLKLEPFGDGGTVLPHERTMSAVREDRYKLLRATGANMSPIVGLYEDRSDRAAELLGELAGGAAGPPTADITDADGVRHRMWVVPTSPGHQDDGSTEASDAHGEPTAASRADELVTLASAGPITIADGHHRYETALRYRDERRMSRSCEEDPPFDYVLTLLLDGSAESVTVLPTHRVLAGIGSEAAAGLLAGAEAFFDVRPTDRAGLVTAFGVAHAADGGRGGRGRFGLWTRSGGAILTARRHALEPWLPDGGAALRRLDVSLLDVALGRLLDRDAGALAASGTLRFTKSADEALAWVDAGTEGADAAFLLDPTPVADILAVARDGDVMPQKSTYFYPKPLSGLVINPHEW